MSDAPLSTDALQAAARWYVRLNQTQPSEADLQAWRAWCEEAEEHRAAWQRVERLKALLAQAPEQAAQTLRRVDQARRQKRRSLLTGVGLLVLGGWMTWALQIRQDGGLELQWLESGAGQRLDFDLPDGGHLLLGPDSRVGLAFGGGRREIHLAKGALQLQTGADQRGRSLRVLSRDGEITPLGTKFVLAQHADATVLSVQADAVEVRPARSSGLWRVKAGQRLRFTSGGAKQPGPASVADDAWTRGMLVAMEQPLGEFLSDLQRQSGQVLSCDPALAAVRVSGSFLAQDAARSLAVLAQQHGWQLRRLNQSWHLTRLQAEPGRQTPSP